MNARTSYIFCVLALIAFTVGAEESPNDSPKKCAWDNCFAWEKDEKIIKVHILSHTHDDMGWIKTVDEYYTGMNHYYSPVGVQYIFNTVISELLSNPDRKFVYAETGFLQRYLEDHGPEELEKLKKLITETGQLELIGGSWVQPDEGASHYVELIDQYTLGLRILNETFGECGIPRAGWQIDPFGHSREHASLLSQIGYDSLYFSRQHDRELASRIANKSLEFMWETSDDLKTRIFTGSFTRGTYAAPNMFCFDVLCKDEPIVDNPRLQDYNIKQKANDFLALVKEQVSHFNHNHALMTMGGDFHYTNANQWFTNLEKLMKHINANPALYGMQLFYSTLSCYTQAAKEAIAREELPVKTADFFPYATNNNGYWTGYFTSKPVHKHIIRDSSSLLQLMRKLNVFAGRSNRSIDEENVLERAVALSIHHDAVTGTAKQFVTNDYQRRIFNGQDFAETAIDESFKILAAKGDTVPPVQTFCRRLNESVCGITTSSNAFVVTMYNGDSQPAKSTLVRIPIDSPDAIVFDATGKTAIPSAVMETFVPTAQFHYQPNISKYELSFTANIPALGFTSFFVRHSNYVGDTVTEEVADEVKVDSLTISNNLISLKFDKKSGLLTQFLDLKSGKAFPLSQQFLRYKSSPLSGAYIFSTDHEVLNISSVVNLTIVKSDLYEEARQIVSSYVSQVIRLWPNKRWVEFDFIVGPLPKNDSGLEGHEIITRYSLKNFNSAGEFQTDANGRQLIKRRRNHAPDFEFDTKERVSGNYYPVNSRILIEDGSTRMTILTDRSQGGSSLEDGEIELMLHRRVFNDDHLGVDEDLNEPGEDGRGLVVRGSHRLIIESIDGKASEDLPAHRRLALELFYEPRVSFSPLKGGDIDTEITNYCKNVKTEYSFLSDDEQSVIPSELNVLTLKWLSHDTILLRLEHIYQGDENADNITFNIQKLFGDKLKIDRIQELKLAANQPVDGDSTVTSPLSADKTVNAGHTKAEQERQWRRNRILKFKSSKKWNSSRFRSFDTNLLYRDFFITMEPMQIRTFKLLVRQPSAMPEEVFYM